MWRVADYRNIRLYIGFAYPGQCVPTIWINVNGLAETQKIVPHSSLSFPVKIISLGIRMFD